jgi:hypothetical protein
MFMRFAALLALVCAFGAASPAIARAQAPDAAAKEPEAVLAAPGSSALAFDSVQVGMLARIDAAGLTTRARAVRVHGHFGDTLLVRGVKNRELLRVPPDRIEWMQVSTGRGWTVNGVTKGALIGVAGGFVLASLVQHFSEPHENQTRGGCPFTFSRECGRSRRVFATGIALGALAGASFAAEAGQERWRFVRLPER